MSSRLILNWDLIEERRVAAGLTRVELATRLGENGTTIDYLWPSRSWRDEDNGPVRVAVLERLCAILDLRPAQLFAEPTTRGKRRRKSAVKQHLDTDVPPAADHAVVEAAVSTLLESVSYTALAQVLTTAQQHALVALTDFDRTLTVHEARDLYEVAMYGGINTDGPIPSAARLVRRGYLRRIEGTEQLIASEDVNYSLLLDAPERWP